MVALTFNPSNQEGERQKDLEFLTSSISQTKTEWVDMGVGIGYVYEKSQYYTQHLMLKAK